MKDNQQSREATGYDLATKHLATQMTVTKQRTQMTVTKQRTQMTVTKQRTQMTVTKQRTQMTVPMQPKCQCTQTR